MIIFLDFEQINSIIGGRFRSSSGPLKEINGQMAGTNCPIIHVELSMLNLPDIVFINLFLIYKYNQ